MAFPGNILLALSKKLFTASCWIIIDCLAIPNERKSIEKTCGCQQKVAEVYGSRTPHQIWIFGGVRTALYRRLGGAGAGGHLRLLLKEA